jgi:hypothetical protein
MNVHNPDALINERESTHGAFNVAAPIMEAILAIYEASPNWHKMTSMQKQTLRMFAHKSGRLLVGNPNYLDHWVDIEGYAHLIVIELTGERYIPGTPEDGGHHAMQEELDFETDAAIIAGGPARAKLEAALDGALAAIERDDTARLKSLLPSIKYMIASEDPDGA